jgi:hypothetical protein
MIVEFKDRDKLNFDINNLELRTRRENLLSNTMCDTSIVKRFLGVKDPELVEKVKKSMPEVIELKRTQLKLKKKLKTMQENLKKLKEVVKYKGRLYVDETKIVNHKAVIKPI